MKSNNHLETFIWTEAFNCGELLEPLLKSFLKHHHYKINIFGFEEDLSKVKFVHPNLIFHDISKEYFLGKSLTFLLKNAFTNGHQGTAVLWAFIIKKFKTKSFIHIDADTIFLGDVITDLINANRLGYQLVGTRRPYKERGYRLNGIDGYLLSRRPDCINTDCFLFESVKIKFIPSRLLIRMILGRRIGFMPVVDFFDPIIFYLLKRNAKIYYIDSLSSNKQDKRNINSEFDLKRISFAAVGSGINFYKNSNVVTSPGYRSYALASYALYSEFVLGVKLPIDSLDDQRLVAQLKSWKNES